MLGFDVVCFFIFISKIFNTLYSKSNGDQPVNAAPQDRGNEERWKTAPPPSIAGQTKRIKERGTQEIQKHRPTSVLTLRNWGCHCPFWTGIEAAQSHFGVNNIQEIWDETQISQRRSSGKEITDKGVNFTGMPTFSSQPQPLRQFHHADTSARYPGLSWSRQT